MVLQRYLYGQNWATILVLVISGIKLNYDRLFSVVCQLLGDWCGIVKEDLKEIEYRLNTDWIKIDKKDWIEIDGRLRRGG